MLAYIHQTCGKPAFLMTAPPAYGAYPSSKNVLYLDGKPMEPLSRIACESCGSSIWRLNSANIRTMI